METGGSVSATDMTERELLRSSGEKALADVKVRVWFAHGSSMKLLSLNLQGSHRRVHSLSRGRIHLLRGRL